MNSASKLLTMIVFAFGVGYKIGQSDADDIKNHLDKFFNFIENEGSRALLVVRELIEKVETMSSEEIKVNIEKLLSDAIRKVNKDNK
jgi:formate dehydrogenase maturation protein FdhE